jgi:hypothetical protein
MADHKPERGFSSPVELIPISLSTAANGQSGVIDMTGCVLIGVQMSTAWTAAGITFLAATAETGTFHSVFGSTGDEITLSADASRFINVSPLTSVGYRWLRVRSGTSGTPVAQAAARTLTLVTRPFQ